MVFGFFKDNTRSFTRTLKVKSAEGLKAASLHLMSKMKQQVSTSAHRGRRRGRIRYEASKPGEAPRLRLGTLRQSITANVNADKLRAKVGVPRNTVYGFYLEVGTSGFVRVRGWCGRSIKS